MSQGQARLENTRRLKEARVWLRKLEASAAEMFVFRAWLFFLLLSACAMVVIGSMPARHNPFASVDLNMPPGLATQQQLHALKHDREACFAALDEAGVLYTPLEDSPPDERCGFYDALTLDRSMTPYSATLQMTCAQAATVYYWERHIVRPAAMETFGSPLVRIETYGSFSCRNIAGSGRLSQHASASAIDITGFRLENGRLIDVKAHWNADGPEGRFLRRVHAGACGLFSVTLGPEYNAAHADHFHMDTGAGRICR